MQQSMGFISIVLLWLCTILTDHVALQTDRFWRYQWDVQDKIVAKRANCFLMQHTKTCMDPVRKALCSWTCPKPFTHPQNNNNNCLVIQHTKSCFDPVRINSCPHTCPNSGGSNQGRHAATSASTKITPAPSTAPTTPRPAPTQCFQCGSSTVPCTAIELLQPTPKTCPPGLDFCAITLSQKAGVQNVFKACVDQTTCTQHWQQVTSNNNKCYNFDPKNRSVDIDCDFCCNKPGCNTGFKPPVADLYDPNHP